MSSNKNSGSARTGIGFAEVLQILFIALKLLKVITWSWWWVLSPTWISLILEILVFAIAIAIGSK